MAFITQDEKKAIAPKVKALLKEYGVKGTLSISNHSKLVLTLKEGNIDFSDRDSKDPMIVEFFKEVGNAMRGPDWFDDSDIQSDYFHTKHYIEICVGTWEKRYVFNSAYGPVVQENYYSRRRP